MSRPVTSVPPAPVRSITQVFAKRRREIPTGAEKRLEQILNSLNNGVLRGKFQREWSFHGKFILDFFFYEVRLGIEVDGGYHQMPSQRKKDRKKERACDDNDITLLRLTNEEVFGPREVLVKRLREAWRRAQKRRREALR